LSFNFAGAHDNLVIDTSGGNPIPTNGVTFNGNSLSNGDTLTIIGSPGDDSISVGSTSASVGTGVVRFSNLAGVTVESVGGTSNNSVAGGTNATPALLVATTDAQIDPPPMSVASASDNSVARMDEDSPIGHAYGAWGPFSFVAAAANPIARSTAELASTSAAGSEGIQRPGFVAIFGNAVITDGTDFSELKKRRSNAWDTLENSLS